jgi:hypothetical protein
MLVIGRARCVLGCSALMRASDTVGFIMREIARGGTAAPRNVRSARMTDAT